MDRKDKPIIAHFLPFSCLVQISRLGALVALIFHNKYLSQRISIFQATTTLVVAVTLFWTSAAYASGLKELSTALAHQGISLGLQDSETVLGNVSGGIGQGSAMQGVAIATLNVDTDRILGFPGGIFHAGALQIHGNNTFSSAYIGSLQTANGNAAANATRLWTLWYQQSFDHRTFDIRVGQQSIDQEFMVSDDSNLFVNTMAGWPTIPSYDLYAGGPAYPLSSLGIRLRIHSTDKRWSFLAGVFDDNPPGGAFANDPQSRDSSGALFNLNTGALVIAEVQFRTHLLAGLPGCYKIGFWFDEASFPDQAYDSQGQSLASPSSNGMPAMRTHNGSIYAVADQTIWQQANGRHRINAFLRIMAAPPDRNLIDFSANGGLTIGDPIPDRPQDSAGIDVGFADVSNRAIELDRAEAFYSNTFTPIRSSETLVELTYQAQITAALQLQPDVQLVINPGGGIANPAQPSKRVRNALIAGIRATIIF